MSTHMIRPAQLEDIDTLYSIFSETDKNHRNAHPEIFKKPSSPAPIKAYYLSCIEDPQAIIYVAEQTPIQIVGAIICRLQQSTEIPILVERDFVCIENITVIPSHRGQGFGEDLMNQAQEWARVHHATALELTVWEFNQGGKMFYEHLGYHTIRRRMVKEMG